MLEKYKQLTPAHKDVLAITGILVVCIIFFSPYIFANPIPLIFPVSDLGTDLNRDVLPNIEYIANIVHTSGEIPLWRSYLLSGAPLVGHPSLPIFYPLNWLLLLAPIPLGLNLLALFDFFWLGAGTYLYLRRSAGYKTLPSLFGAVAMAISPKWIAHLSGGHWFLLMAVAWFPWALLALDRYWNTRRIAWVALLAVALASQGMNHLPIFVITAFTLVILSFTFFSSRCWKDWVVRMASSWTLVIVLTLGLSAAQILPFVELLPNAIHTSENVTFTSLNPVALLVSIFPPDCKYPEWFLFLGVTVLLFAGLSWAYGWRRFEKTWGIIGLLGLVLSLGEYTPVYNWLLGWNGLISALRVPTRWWLLTITALVILAASGFGQWLENSQHLSRRAMKIAYLILGLEVLAGGMRLFLGELFPFDTISTAVIDLVLGMIIGVGQFRPGRYIPGLIFICLVAELVIVGRSLIRPQDVGETGVSENVVEQIVSRLADSERVYSPGEGFPALALVRWGINAAEGYDALPLANYVKFIHQATGCPLVQEATGSTEELTACLNPQVVRLDWLKLINVRLLAVQQNGQWKITNLPPGVGRLFSTREVESTTASQCLSQLETIDPTNVALVEGEVGEGSSGSINISARVQGVNNEIFQVTVRDKPALLVRSENWAPGWHARVDGQSASVLRTDCILQGVWLEPGAHTVEFYYQPFSYPAGLWISAGTLLAILLGLGIIFWLEKRK